MPNGRYRPKGKRYRHFRRRSGWQVGTVIGTVLIVIAVPLFLIGLVALLSPMTFLWLASHLPENIQNVLFGDMFWGATPRSWAYLIAAFLLGFIGFWLRSRARRR
jgi:hypothetical protein